MARVKKINNGRETSGKKSQNFLGDSDATEDRTFYLRIIIL